MNKVFEKYKNIHENKRAFLVANGPSLNDIDLDLIKDEISFGMNRISLAYKNTKWRPTYYLFSSTNVRHDKPWAKQWQKSVKDSLKEEKVTSFVADMFMPYIDPYGNFPNTKWFNSLSENKPNLKGEIIDSCFSTNVVERIDKSGMKLSELKEYLYTNTTFERGDLQNRGLYGFIGEVKKDKINLFKSIENLNIVVSGGYPGGYSMVCFGSGISLTEGLES